MFYVTSYNRFGQRYTSVHDEMPRLRNNPTLNIRQLRLDELTEEEKQYSSFRIPKTSGGFREINAPTEILKTNQRKIVTHLQDVCKVLESPWAFAYIKNTCAVDALKKHQDNRSKWFLKLDIKDFFPSCTPAIVHASLGQLFPICSWDEADQTALTEIINNYCFHNGHLPQGAVTSPYLSNLTLLPYDKRIHQMLRDAEEIERQRYVFTRYADDILISAKNPFNWQEIASRVQTIFGQAFTLKPEKTRYGSNAGRNWNLGCMLNAENNITIGYKAKEEWKRKMMNIIIRNRANEPITNAEKQQLNGLLAYYKSIEPDYFNYLERHYREKYNVSFEAIIRTTL